MFRVFTFASCYREIPLYFGKHSLQYYVVPCECTLLFWAIFSVYISPLKAMFAYRLFEKIHHAIDVCTGYQQHQTSVRGTYDTRVYMVSTTLYTCIQVSITHVYTQVSLKLHTSIHGINNTMHVYTRYQQHYTRVCMVSITQVYTWYH